MNSGKPRVKIIPRRRFTLYAVLGVPPGAAPETIRAAYLALAKAKHPDIPGNSDVAFADITAAYGTLKDPELRALYDKTLTMYPDKCKGCEGKGLRIKSRGFSSRYSAPCPDCDGTGWEEDYAG